MPTGAFGLSPDSRAGGSLTGSGPASQPKNPRLSDQYPLAGVSGSTTMSQSRAQPGSAAYSSTKPAGTSTQLGAGQFPLGQGPSAYSPGSIAQYPNPAPSLLGPAQSLVDTLYGPQQQLLVDQLARQREQLGMINLDADYRSGALQRDNSLALKSLGLDKKALGVDANLTKTQQANLAKLRGILTKQYGLAGETLANQMSGFQIDEDKARDMAKRETFDLRSILTSRGAFNTIANERGTGRINRDLQYGLRQIDVGRGGANINYRGSILGLDEKGIGYDNQAAGLNARLQGIGIDMQRLGISEEQLANSLADGLHQIGLDSYLSLNGLLDAIGSTNSQQSQMAATILQEVMGYANLPPDVLRQIQAMLGGASAGTGQSSGSGNNLPGSRVPR